MISNPEQLTFDLGHRSAKGREDFLISLSNQNAVGWIDKWPDWAAPALILYGPVASGKSHLASVWAENSGAELISLDDVINLEPDEIVRRSKNIYIIRGDLLIGDRLAETNLFHIYNILKEEKRSMLMTMRCSPAYLDFEIPDLSSRLRAAPLVSIDAPDDVLLSSLLVKLFHDRQIKISEAVINYLVPRMERSFSAALDIVGRADNMALEKQKPVSLSLIRDVLQERNVNRS